ncbi:MAG: hypothetical protein F6K55_03220 [Moorea sp. SIO4A3]|nr:hypothetical protein [Moorena sp. SIO4A3]
MIQQKVSLSITARNLTRPAIRSVTSSLNALKGQADSTSRRIANLGQKIRTAVNSTDDLGTKGTRKLLRLNAGLMLLDATAGILSSSFSKLGNAIGEAFQYELNFIQQVDTVRRSLGQGTKEAREFVRETNRLLSASVANLPVSGSYTSNIGNAILDDIYDLSQFGFTGLHLQELGVQMVRDAAVLGQSSGVQSSDVSLFFGRLLNTATLADLRNLRFGEQNPAYLRSLESRAQANYGTTNLRALNRVQRQQLATEVNSILVNATKIAELQSTASASVSSFMDILFSPHSGVFSLVRETAPDQSIIKSFGQSLRLLIGKDGIIMQIGRLSGLASETFSLGVQGMLGGINQLLSTFNESLTSMTKFDATEFGAAVGQFGVRVVNSITTNTLSAIAGIDRGAIVEGLNTAISSFIANLDWRVYLAGAGAILGGLVLKGLIGLGVTLAGAVVTAVGGVPLLIGGAIVLGVTGVVLLIRSQWENITQAVTGILGTVKEFIVSSINLVFNSIKSIFKTIGAVTGSSLGTLGDAFGNGAKGFIPALSSEMKLAPRGSYPIIANSSEFILSPGQMSAFLTASQQQASRVVNVGGITVNVNQEQGNLADEVIQKLEDALVHRLEAAL